MTRKRNRRFSTIAAEGLTPTKWKQDTLERLDHFLSTVVSSQFQEQGEGREGIQEWDRLKDFIGELLPALLILPRLAGRPAIASEFRAVVHGVICRFVGGSLRADCVYLRRLRTDGSTELLDEPFWLVADPYGRPPDVIRKSKDVFGCILSAEHKQPVLIRDTSAKDNRYKKQFHALLKSFTPGTDEHHFLSEIRADVCIPLIVGDQPVAGIIAVRRQPYDPRQAAKVKASIELLQDFLSALYFAGLQLEHQEKLQNRLRAVCRAVPSLVRCLTDDEFLRTMVALLTCKAGLEWQRAFVFLLEGAYPCPARCVAALDSSKEPHSSSADLTSYLRRTWSADFAANDPLFQRVQRASGPLTVPRGYMVDSGALHALFVGDTPLAPEEEGVLPVCFDDPWLQHLPGFESALAGVAWECPRYIVPLFQPSTGFPLGFVVLDNPYAYPVEFNPNFAVTRLFCDVCAGHLADRELGAEGWLEQDSEKQRQLAACQASVRQLVEDEGLRKELMTRVQRGLEQRGFTIPAVNDT